MLNPLRDELGPERFKTSLASKADDLINNSSIQRPGIEGIAKSWVDLCELTPTSTHETNPYHAVVRTISYWIPDGSVNFESAAYFSFVGCLTQEFADLLQAKDHRALLILAHWFSLLLISDFWWCRTRAYVECKSICMYLERYATAEIKQMLDYPAKACGYKLLSDMSLEEGPLARAVPDTCTLM